MRTSRLSAVDNWRALAEGAMFRPRALAKLVGVGLRDLQLFVHRRTGRSVHDWLNELRLRIATQRLGQAQGSLNW
jgi:transcriptional regulator GlxA family with amidase domain